jgi:hypothetical protein
MSPQTAGDGGHDALGDVIDSVVGAMRCMVDPFAARRRGGLGGWS